MDDNQTQPGSQLFSIRLWPENLGHGETEWRGQVRHLASGETVYFRELRALVAFLQACCPIQVSGAFPEIPLKHGWTL